jgi:hypothetical protein
MMFTILLLFTVHGLPVAPDEVGLDKRPTLEDVEKALAVCAIGSKTVTGRGGYTEYLTGWLPFVVAEVDWRRDEKGVCRVTNLEFRLRERTEIFLPLRRIR